MPLNVTLFPLSNILHLRQVFTGFHALESDGLLSIRYSADGAARLGVAPTRDLDRKSYCLGAEIDGIGLVVYDLHDSDVIVDEALARAAVYFKRGYHPGLHGSLAKVRPLGLNLGVEGHASGVAMQRALRFGRGRSKYGDVLRALGISPTYAIRERDLTALPVARSDPKVLFLTRVWTPTGYYGVTPDETADRTVMNEARAACVRQLRTAFGPRFTGGLLPDAFALEHFPDLVVTDTGVTRKDLYLRSVDAFDVCVTTRGLLNSTGWKFAEYLAKGRAIVSEPLIHQATGPLEADRHYLPFGSADECVAAVDRLFTDTGRRQAMMVANRNYYAAFVKPDALVLNSLAVALASAQNSV